MQKPTVIPDRTEPLIGWRVWRVVANPEATLRSLTRAWVCWMPFERMESECQCEQNRAFHLTDLTDEHTCGLYACGDFLTVLQYQPDGFLMTVVGRVALWGRVTIHKNGVFRAQYAYPVSFVYNSTQRPSQKGLEVLAEQYGVTVDPGDLATETMKVILEALEASPWKRV